MNPLLFLFFFLFTCLSLGHLYPNSPIKAIIFDCDGTLIDNGMGYFLDWQYALQCQGYELDEDMFWDFMNQNKIVGRPGMDKTIAKFCCELVGLDCPDKVLQDKKAFSAKLHQTYEFPAIEPTVEFLHTLGKEKENLGLKIGLASGNKRVNILRVLKRLNVEHYFDVIVSADDITEYHDPEGTNKPKPYVYLQAAKLLQVEPNECIAIEDSHAGVTSAISAGCITIAIPNRQTTGQDLSQAHLKLISLVDVTPSDFLQSMTKLY